MRLIRSFTLAALVALSACAPAVGLSTSSDPTTSSAVDPLQDPVGSAALATGAATDEPGPSGAPDTTTPSVAPTTEVPTAPVVPVPVVPAPVVPSTVPSAPAVPSTVVPAPVVPSTVVPSTVVPTTPADGPSARLGAGAPLAFSMAAGSSAAAASSEVVLERGHVDLIEVTRDGSALKVQVKDDTGSSVVFRSPEQVQVRVGDGALTQVPDGPFGFLGAPGAPVYLLPQVQDPALIWPGWSTERLSAGQVVGDVVGIRLVSVDGPGALALFTTDQFGAPKVLFDSDGGVDEVSVPIRTHAHANWAFSAPGVHRVTFEVSGELPGAGRTATRVTYVMLVGDAAAPVDPGTVAPPAVVPPGASSSGGVASGAGAPTAGGTGAGPGAAGAETASGGAGSSAATGAQSGPLARTGSSSDLLALVGVLLVVAGLVALAAGRRRATSPVRR